MPFVTKQVLVFTGCIILQITMLCVIYKATDISVEEKRIPPATRNPGGTYLRRRSLQDSSEISSLNKTAVTQQKETADKNVNFIKSETTKMTNYNSSLQTQIKVNEDELPPCVFHFDEDDRKYVSKIVRQAKSQSVYIIYLTLKVENDTESHEDKNEFNFDDLVDWQIVDKSEKFLEELPIDFDLITFHLFWVDNEVKEVDMHLRKNNSNCQMKSKESIEAVQSLLWKEILNNSTNYYLCNRLYNESAFRNFIYYLTTVWIGYDLKCSEWPQKTVYLNKTLPGLIAIFCYLLSLQFVWIFSALDIKHRREGDNNKLVPISVYFKKEKMHSKEFNYGENDRPCGIRRVLLKLFYGKRETCSSCSPSRRLFALVWIFIIMPFSLYKVIGRHLMYKSIYKKTWNAIRTSEPFFNCIDSENGALACDILYATFIPCLYIILVEFYYKSFISDDFSLFTLPMLTKICFTDNDQQGQQQQDQQQQDQQQQDQQQQDQQQQQQDIVESFTGINDRFISRIYILKNACNACSETRSCHCCLKNTLCVFDFPFQMIFSIFPFFTFAFHCLIYNIRKNTKFNDWSKYCKGVVILCIFIVYFLTYNIIFRPMLSTFTFIFRIIMYFVFVTLAIRIHLFRYTLIIVMAIFYFVRYLVEIINMKSEILKYIFEYKRKDNINENETINEKEFNEVTKRLLFEKRKKYFFCLKSIVVFICLAVIMMIFIFSGTSKTAGNFKEMLELVLFLISPFAISVFLKAHDKEILSKDDKRDIEIAYDEYQNNPNEETPLIQYKG